MNTSKKIRSLKNVSVDDVSDKTAATPDPNAPTGRGKYRNPEQDIAGYLLTLYFLSKYKFFEDRGFDDYKKNMVYFRTVGDYSGPFIDMYKQVLGAKATDANLQAFEKAGKLARALNYRPTLLKAPFRPLRTMAMKIPHTRIKQFTRSISHYFEHGSKPDPALEKAMIAEVRPVIKHYRMKRMLDDVAKNLDEIVKAGNLFDESDDEVQPLAQAAKAAPPKPKPKPKVYTVDELKALGRMELLEVVREAKDEDVYAKVVEASVDKAVLAYLANVKSYFTGQAVEAYKDANIFKRAWIANLRPAAKLALIKQHDFNADGGQTRLPDYWYGVKILDNATPAVLEAWLKARFRYKNPSSRNTIVKNTVKELDKHFRENPELLTRKVVELLLASDFREYTLQNWLPDSIAMEMKDTKDAAVLVAVINRSEPADAIKLLRENIPNFSMGELTPLKKHIPPKWRLIANVGSYYGMWENWESAIVTFLSDSDLVREFEKQAQKLVEILLVEKSRWNRDRLSFREVYTKHSKIRPVLIKFSSSDQLRSLEEEQRDEFALEAIRELETEELSTQTAWFAQNWDPTKNSTASEYEFSQAAQKAPATELPALYDAAMGRFNQDPFMANRFERMPDEQIYRLVMNERLSESDRRKYAKRMPAGQWAQYLDTDNPLIKELMVTHCEPDFLPTVLAHQNYKGIDNFLNQAIPRLSKADLEILWDTELKARMDDSTDQFANVPRIRNRLAEFLPDDRLEELAPHFEALGAGQEYFLQRIPADQLDGYLDKTLESKHVALIIQRGSNDLVKEVYERIKNGSITPKKSSYLALIERLSGQELSGFVLDNLTSKRFSRKDVLYPLYKKLPTDAAKRLAEHIFTSFRQMAYGDEEVSIRSFTRECLTTDTLTELLEGVGARFSDYDKNQLISAVQGDRVDQFLGNLRDAENDGDFKPFLDQLFAQEDSSDLASAAFAREAIRTIFSSDNRELLNSMLASGHSRMISASIKKLGPQAVLEHIPASEVRAHFKEVFDKLMPSEVKDPARWDLNDAQQAFMKSAPANRLIDFYSWAYENSLLPKLMSDILTDRIKEWKTDFKNFFLAKGRDFRKSRWVKGSFPIILASDDSEVLERIQRTRIGRDIKVGDAGDVHKHYTELAPLEREKYLDNLTDRVLVEKIFMGELSQLLPKNTKVEQALAVSTSGGGTNAFINKIKTKFKETSLSVAVYEILQYKSLDEVKELIKDDPLAILEFARPTQTGDTLLDETSADDLKKLQADMKKAWDFTQHSSFRGNIQAAYEVKMKAGMQADDKKKKKSKNVLMLYHGTSYYAAGFILQNGFKVMKNPTTGRMFGDGIYFTDISSKAAQYVSSKGKGGFGRYDDDGVMMLCEVDMGNMLTLTNSSPHSDRYNWIQKGYDSIFAPKGVQNLRNSEYIVKDVSRIRVVYVFDLKRTRT